jgi:uncharacterized OB-fold protein
MTLLERDPTAPSDWNDEMQVTNRYTFGVAGERFFRSIKDEAKILGTHCNNCERTYVPASLFCERCLDQLDDWVDVGTAGEIVTFTHLYVNYDDSPRSVPETVAFIKLGDGGIIHRLMSSDLQQIEIGMTAKAVFKPKADREGSILDIRHFELIKS